uniref:RNA-binding protein 28 n=1 Tax=Anabas testudineus TaxID=64144 RepID=A0A3Q1H2J9_ANATE
MPAQTIFVGSLPASASNERLEEIFSEIGPIKQCFVVREKGTEKCRGFGYVTYSMEEDAQRALKEVKEYDGKRLSLSVAKKKIKDKKKAEKNEQQSKGFRKKQMKARLIIRNLSFKCSEDDLKEVFSKFGTVLESKIPLKPDGKMRGFAFVMFKNVPQAAKALNTMNLKEIKGRQVAVDWAVPKDKFIATQHSSGAGIVNFTSKAAVQQVEESQSDDEDDNEEEDSDEDEDDDDDDEDEKEEDDDDEEEEDDHDDDDDDDGSSLDSNDDEDESQDDEEDEDDEGDSAQKKKTSKKLLPSDVKEGRTVFIRNLSFDTEDEGLEEVLLQYGELNYIKIVVHPDTEHSKGCAFAQFKTKEAADRCIAAAQDEAENGGIRVDGRKLLIVAAVTREDAAKMKVNKVKVETGTRNMYLAREGLIRAGTKAAEGVSEADMAKRTRFEEIKRAKLRDINVFVSKTRLCVHNLPKSVDNKKLKSLCLQAVKGAKGVRITECRVMYDKKPQKGQVMGQSLGYGFVQFQESLSMCLYVIPQRPIVEFSLEDSRKLKIKEMRQQKNKVCFCKFRTRTSTSFFFFFLNNPLWIFLQEFLQNRPFKGKQHSQTSGDDKGPRKSGSKPQSSLEQMGKQRAPPQNKKKDGNYSGFQTNPEVEHVDLENGKKRRKVLPLPSHRGPKIRMRDKGKQQAPPPKKARPGSKRKEHQKRHLEKSRDGDRFDSLVEQYKKKLMGNSDKNTSIKRSKWFDS